MRRGGGIHEAKRDRETVNVEDGEDRNRSQLKGEFFGQILNGQNGPIGHSYQVSDPEVMVTVLCLWGSRIAEAERPPNVHVRTFGFAPPSLTLWWHSHPV